MSSLTIIEKKYFESLFDMANGYVMDFTNDSFYTFCKEIANVDIYLDKPRFIAVSKANRLREFWDSESDQVVGKLLSGLLEVWKLNRSDNSASANDLQYIECQNIVNRLLGKDQTAVNSELQFMSKDFGNISLSEIGIEPVLLPVLEGRLNEISKCMHSGAPLSVILLCGSILEGVLLNLAIKNPKRFNEASISPKNREGKVKQFHEWNLAQFIDVACEIGFITLDVKKYSHSLRDFRNYIHPFEQMASRFNPDIHTAKISYQVLKAAVACLSGDRK